MRPDIGAGVEDESENVLFLFSLGCVSFKGPSMNLGSLRLRCGAVSSMCR